MPDSLPEGAKKIWETVFDKAKASGDSEETAAKKAWGALKRSGWSKGEDGTWHKASLAEFSLNVKKAAINNGEMCWRADTSDTEADLYDDNMSLELFADFLRRIEADEQAPEQFRSDFWSGGTPYLSISHYDDLNGDGVPGTVDAVYVDGKFLKARGRFYDSPLGKACFASLQKDLKQIKATSEYHDGRVRVSIAFLDWMHKHKSEGGYVFERKSLDDICPECLRELLEGEKSGKTFLKGQLVHLALTRVPVNTRTIMEVDKSMTTKKEDAASIIGEELADELDTKAKTALKSAALVEFSDAEETPVEEAVSEPVVEEAKHGKEMEDEEDDEEEKKEKDSEYKAVLEMLSVLSANVEEIKKERAEKVSKSVHPLEGAIDVLKASYDNVIRLEMADDEKLKVFQSAFNEFAESVIGSMKPKKADVVESNNTGGNADDLVKAFSQAIQPLADKLELALTKMESRAVQPSEQGQPRITVPARRSIPTLEVAEKVQEKAKSVTPNLRALIDRNT